MNADYISGWFRELRLVTSIFVTTGHTSFQVLSLLACFDVVDHTLLPSNGQPAKTLMTTADARATLRSSKQNSL